MYDIMQEYLKDSNIETYSRIDMKKKTAGTLWYQHFCTKIIAEINWKANVTRERTLACTPERRSGSREIEHHSNSCQSHLR